MRWGDADLFAAYKEQHLLETAELYLDSGEFEFGTTYPSGYSEPVCLALTPEMFKMENQAQAILPLVAQKKDEQ